MRYDKRHGEMIFGRIYMIVDIQWLIKPLRVNQFQILGSVRRMCYVPSTRLNIRSLSV